MRGRLGRKIQFGLIGGLIVAGVVVWAFRRPDGELPGLHMALVTAAEEAGIGGTFHLSDVAGFSWDRAHVFPPYSAGAVTDELGFDWSPLAPAPRLLFEDVILSSEGLNLVVFVEGEETVTGWSILGTAYLEQPYLEVSRTGSPIVIERDADLLSVELPPFGPAEDAYLLSPPEP